MQEKTPVVRFRARRLRALARRAGITTDSALAARLGIQQSTVMRMLGTDYRAGGKTIAATLAAFPGAKFEDLFEITEEGAATVDGDAA